VEVVVVLLMVMGMFFDISCLWCKIWVMMVTDRRVSREYD
jgi:hypothetical protein